MNSVNQFEVFQDFIKNTRSALGYGLITYGKLFTSLNVTTPLNIFKLGAGLINPMQAKFR
jgi:hypothetical protein